MKTAEISRTAALVGALGTTYPVMEHFYTLQGEGAHSGAAAYFIRLAGCDVGCHWCDVKESWPEDAHPRLSCAELLAAVKQTPTELVVITGGEPLLHDLGPLTRALHSEGYKLNIETSGTRPLSGEIDWVCFSPKKFKAPLETFYERADELKIIVHNRHDLQWAETHAAKCRPDCALYLQPEWFRPESAGWIIEYVKADPKWRVSLQTHKYMEIP